eukprot:2317020-Alexandrium_andersonii.AAC.1
MHHTPRTMHSVPRTTYHAPRTARRAPRTTHHTPHTTHGCTNLRQYGYCTLVPAIKAWPLLNEGERRCIDGWLMAMRP